MYLAPKAPLNQGGAVGFCSGLPDVSVIHEEEGFSIIFVSDNRLARFEESPVQVHPRGEFQSILLTAKTSEFGARWYVTKQLNLWNRVHNCSVLDVDTIARHRLPHAIMITHHLTLHNPEHFPKIIVFRSKWRNSDFCSQSRSFILQYPCQHIMYKRMFSQYVEKAAPCRIGSPAIIAGGAALLAFTLSRQQMIGQ